MSDVVITADVLDPSPGPALSATSDMPVIGEAEAPPAPETPPEAVEGGEAVQTPEAEAGEAEGAEEGEAEPEAGKPAKKTGINQRFSDLTVARKAAEAKAEAESKRAEAAERALAEALARIPKPDEKAAEPVEPPAPDPRPIRESFETPEAYDEALIEWSTKRAVQISQAEQAQHAKSEKEAADRVAAEQTQQTNFAAIQKTHADRVAAVAEKYPDYAEVTGNDDLKISAPMAMAILQSEDGPDAAYYLAKHPEQAEKIAAMVIPGQVFPQGHPFAGQPIPDAQRQLLEMGKVFAAVAQPETPAPKPTPPPPAPITPLRRGSNAAVTRTLDDIGRDTAPGAMDEYAARRLEQLRAERTTH